MPCEYSIEAAIGLFDVAISHSSDSGRLAQVLLNYSKTYGLICYSYEKRKVAQLGLNIVKIMKFVYTRTPRLAIINSPLYLTTAATQLEFNIMLGIDAEKSITVFEVGGSPLTFSSKQNVQYVTNIVDTEIISIVAGWKESLRRKA
jgi:hypothetical protein